MDQEMGESQRTWVVPREAKLAEGSVLERRRQVKEEKIKALPSTALQKSREFYVCLSKRRNRPCMFFSVTFTFVRGDPLGGGHRVVSPYESSPLSSGNAPFLEKRV